MESSNLYEGIGHVVHISTNVTTGCEHCRHRIGGNEFAQSVNHYINEHGYRLLHVGSESSDDDEGRLWNFTVAVLGQ